MALSPSFLLKKPSKATGLSLVYLQTKWNGQRLIYSTGQTVSPKQWDRNKQRVKNNNAATKDGLHLLNDLLSKLEEVLKTAFRIETVNGGTPTVAQIKKHLDNFFNQNLEQERIEAEKPKFYELVNKFINNEILYKGKPKALSTIKSYKTTLKHLKGFEKETGYTISYESITLPFFYDFINYLSAKGINQNAKNKYIGVLKSYMSEAFDLGFTNNVEFRRKKFGIAQKLSETVYLKEDEIERIYNCKFDNINLTNVKDAFLLACATGLRFSDFSTLKLQDIKVYDGEAYIKKSQQKTGAEVIIPLNDMSLEIIKKYKDTKNGFPKVPGNQVFNKQIKTICKSAELFEKGRLTEDPTKELWECISAHTGRRSFATNAHINNIQSIDIMRITGHATEKSFLRYIRLSKLDAAKRFSHHIKMKQLSKTMLKAV